MYIKSVKLNNFKSFTDAGNTIQIEKEVTTIIGKNESGKSNILNGISKISFFNNMSSAYSDNVKNISLSSESPITYEVLLKDTSEDNNIGIVGESEILFSKDANFTKGSIYDFYDNKIKENAQELITLLGNNPFQLSGTDYQTFLTRINSMVSSDSIDLQVINDAINFLDSKIKAVNLENKNDILQKLNSVKNEWQLLKNQIPNIYYRPTDNNLKTTYKLDEVKNELANKDSILFKLVKLIDISNDDFTLATQGGQLNKQVALRERIKTQIENQINIKFNDFYKTEKVKLSIDFQSNVIGFTVLTSEGDALKLDERSNGLRWYINLFIDAYADNKIQKNTLFLFDEPGISLHINAQKELISLFRDLSSENNQVLYTTHMPSMLSLEDGGLDEIRAVVKETNGNSKIYNRAWSGKICKEYQMDTYAPIIAAIGMNINSEFGPSLNKINVVCEGSSDYIYLQSIYNNLDSHSAEMNFIPSVGASNVIQICSILKGWGCKFVGLFDCDKGGVEGAKKFLVNGLYEYGIDFLFLKNKDFTKVNPTEYKIPYTMENFVGETILNEIIKIGDLPVDASTSEKTLLAKMFSNHMTEFALEDTKKRFIDLFNRIEKSQKQY